MNTQLSASGTIAMLLASSLAPIFFDASIRQGDREEFARVSVADARGLVAAAAAPALLPLTTPINDGHTGAINAHHGRRRVSLANATKGVEGQGDTSCWDEDTVENDVWFLYEAPANGTLTISMCASESQFDSRIAVYAYVENELPIDAIACNDDACGEHASVELAVTEGQLVLIQVGAADLQGPGEGFLDVTLD